MAYAIAVFSIGLIFMIDNQPIKILIIAISIFWIIQSHMNYLDYRYEMEKELEEMQEQSEKKENQEGKEEG